MARATTKEQLIQNGDDNFIKLFSLINSISKEDKEKNFSFEDRDKNIRDVLIHLFEWHQLLINWVRCNQSGIKVNFLPEPYNWKTYPQMNMQIWEKHQSTSLKMAIELLEKSHLETMKIIDTFSNEQLFTNRFFDWTGTTSLGSYCVSATASHYDWAIKKIKVHQKSLST